MRLTKSPVDAAILSALIFPFLAAAASNLDCKHASDDGLEWDFSALGGPKSVLQTVDEGASWENTTYTIDLCNPLKRNDKVPDTEKCPGDTRLCAIERIVSHDQKSNTLRRVWPVAGDLKEKGGSDIEPVWTRLKARESSQDAEGGVSLSMGGGYWLDPVTKKKRTQKAIIAFMCDKTRNGDENLWNSEDKYENSKLKRAEEGDKKNEENDPKSPSLQFVSYESVAEDVDELHLRWLTKHACTGAKGEPDGDESSHWGFFTWFIIIAFLSTATYLIFGSWLNYNRYGARGWDLLPHGDTIRDVPYLLKDWTRRVLNTLQGGGSRGGYAAV